MLFPNNRGNFWWSSGTLAAGGLPSPSYVPENSHFPQMVLEGQMGHQTVPLITLIHPILIVMDLARTNGMVVAALNAPTQFRRSLLKEPLWGHNSAKQVQSSVLVASSSGKVVRLGGSMTRRNTSSELTGTFSSTKPENRWRQCAGLRCRRPHQRAALGHRRSACGLR